MKKLSPAQKIPSLNGHTIGNFWQWAFSDILTNTTRGIFAEYVVGVALDAVADTRIEEETHRPGAIRQTPANSQSAAEPVIMSAHLTATSESNHHAH